jgi:long-chain acyl-CoA synthetase
VARETLLDCFDELARAPGPYLVDDDGFRVRRHSRVEVAAAARGFSARLAAAGIGQGDHAVIWSENRPEWVVAFWGCVRRGVVVVPVDARTSAEFVARVARLVHPRVVLVGDDVTGLSPELVMPVWRLADVDWHAESAPAVSIGRGDVAEIVFTSGATDDPKGVVITHANLLANIEPVAAQIDVYRRRARPVLPLGILNLLPLSHMFGQALALFIPPLLPGVVYFMREAHPARVVGLIRRHRVSVLVAVPRVLELLRTYVLHVVPEAAAPPPEGEHWLRRWWRYRRLHRLFGVKFWSLVVGGAPLDSALEQFWARRAFAVIQGYGLTETAPIVTMTHPFRIRAGSVGTALTGVEVRIAPDGEILVRGDNVARRYVGADGVRATTTDDGWFHTGDLGALDPDGRLFVRGRKKDVIVAADGSNVIPDDVERAVGAVAGVREAAVVGVSTPALPGERIHAVVVVDPGVAVDRVAREANARLEPHQRVWRVVVWPDAALPRTPGTGKLQRAVVRDWARRGAAAARFSGDSHADRLAALVAAHTGHTGLSPATTLDELGLGSLDRLELQVAIEDAFQTPLDETALAGVRDLGELRALVDRTGTAPESDAEAQPMPAWNRRWPARVARWLALTLVLLPVTRLCAWLHVVGRDQLGSLDGPVVFASNHQTYGGAATPSPVPRRTGHGQGVLRGAFLAGRPAALAADAEPSGLRPGGAVVPGVPVAAAPRRDPRGNPLYRRAVGERNLDPVVPRSGTERQRGDRPLPSGDWPDRRPAWRHRGAGTDPRPRSRPASDVANGPPRTCHRSLRPADATGGTGLRPASPPGRGRGARAATGPARRGHQCRAGSVDMISPATASHGGAVVAAVTALAVLTPSATPSSQGPAADPFAFLAPAVVVSAGERQRLDRGEVISRTLEAGDRQAVVFVATRLNAAPEALVAWTRAISAIKRNVHVLAIRRFSEPPVLSDLDGLVLDQRDLEDLRDCRAGDCGLKLTAGEIAKLVSPATAGRPGPSDAVQRAFRQVVLDRVLAYRAQGLAAMPALADNRRARRIAEGLAALIDRSPYLERVPAVVPWLRQYPQGEAANDSFLYWSKEGYGNGKPVISVTHVGIFTPPPAPGRPAVLVASKQLLATHYSNASLGLMMVMPGIAGAPSYFGYLNRTELDVLGGLFGGIARLAVERRLARQVPILVGELRGRLESGPPPLADR